VHKGHIIYWIPSSDLSIPHGVYTVHWVDAITFTGLKQVHKSYSVICWKKWLNIPHHTLRICR